MGTTSLFPKKLIRPDISRGQILATSLFAFFVYATIAHTKLPFDHHMASLALVSAFFHLALFLAFNFVFPLNSVLYSCISLFNYVLLGFFIHFSGGVLSPFVFVFFFILISDSANANSFAPSLIASLTIYLGVVGAEYFGFLKPTPISPSDIYASLPALLIVVGAVVLFLVIVGQAYKVIITGLRKRLEVEHAHKEKMKRQLAKLDASSQLGLVVNKIVHDIRGPLGAVMCFIDLIREENILNAESNKDCEVMIKEVERISNMLNHLIKYAKPEQMEKHMVCPVDLMTTVLSVLNFYPGAKHIRITHSFPDPNQIWIYASKEELQQIVFNLLKNAVEGLSKKEIDPQIHCSIHSDNTSIYIEIKDNGSGIPKHVLSQLLKMPLSTKISGGGIGLLIVQEMISNYGGNLKIDSQEGIGTSIVVKLPRYAINKTKTGADKTHKHETLINQTN